MPEITRGALGAAPAAGQGFEPWPKDPKSLVLPLHYPAISIVYLILPILSNYSATRRGRTRIFSAHRIDTMRSTASSRRSS